MYCPFCRNADSRVIDSRTADDGSAIRRRRECPACGRRFTTVETSRLRGQALGRVRAVQPGEDHLGREEGLPGASRLRRRPRVLAQKVEETIRGNGQAEIDALDIGLAILPPLRELDEIAYLRFASVYQAFDSLDDFERAIARLREEDAAK